MLAFMQLYGSWAVAHLNMVRADCLMLLGSQPNLWHATHPFTGAYVCLFVCVCVRSSACVCVLMCAYVCSSACVCMLVCA